MSNDNTSDQKQHKLALSTHVIYILLPSYSNYSTPSNNSVSLLNNIDQVLLTRRPQQ